MSKIKLGVTYKKSNNARVVFNEIYNGKVYGRKDVYNDGEWQPYSGYSQSIEEWIVDEELIEVSAYDDWKIDDKIWVRDDAGQVWRARHFAGVNDKGEALAWDSGSTSFTRDPQDMGLTWNFVKRDGE